VLLEVNELAADGSLFLLFFTTGMHMVVQPNWHIYIYMYVCISVAVAKFIVITICLQREIQIHHLESMQVWGLMIRLLMNVRYALIDNFVHAKILFANLFCYVIIS
jgi:hypothetical protein